MPLRWGDLDAYGHVNNATMLRLLEEARIRAFIIDDSPAEPSPAAVFPAGAHDALWTLIASQQIEYLLPIPYLRDPLRIQTWIGALGGASVEVCYEVESPESAGSVEVYARASTVLVLVDAATGKPTRITQEMRRVLETYVEEPIAFARRR